MDGERSHFNIDYCNENIKKVYHKLFDEALQRYNEKQTRSDRRIDNYYEKIRNSKQEKPFHELILQIGDKENMGAWSENGNLARQVLDEYYQQFQKRNPNLYVFSAHLHMDEATPHLHIDFVPFTTGSKRGLDTRVSLKQALAKQGLMSAKTYKNKLAEPLVQKLKSLVKTALIRCFEAYDSYYRLNITNSNLHRENERLTKTNEKLAGENENLRAENKNYKLLKKAFGSKQMDSLLEQAKAFAVSQRV